MTIALLPSWLNVFEPNPYIHEFTVPGDASNARLAGEFTVQPRPQGRLDMLLVSADAVPHWQEFLSVPATPNSSSPTPAYPGLLYRSGDTIADHFEIKLLPGSYELIFYFGPAPSEQADHYGCGWLGPCYRQVSPTITLTYELPQETGQ